MKTRRVKRSEAFWPAIVMKKWLNIKPKVYDFSEDEVDTETESEDDVSSPTSEKIHPSEDCFHRLQESKSACSNHTSDIASKSYPLKHRRGKSETLRVQYINAKDVRVTIGSWNVAGKLPTGDLEIDDWLHMQEPADIYILGFQEVVPLNAGNVLGPEDSRPIPKWEAIIRRTLNNTLEPGTKHKSYSAPTSPLLRSFSAPGVLADNNTSIALDFEGDELNKNIGRKKYDLDMGNRLDWPEQSLDTTPQVLSGNSKLRRVLSSSGYSHQSFEVDNGGLKRMHRSSENLGLMWMEQEEKLEVLDSLLDVSEQFSEDDDDSFFESPETLYENVNKKNCSKKRPRFVRIVSKQMVGIYLSVWVRGRLRRHINNLKVSPVGVGLMGYMGNKGSVSLSMSLYQSRLCFVCSHLTSGHKDGDEQRRNSDVNEILRRTRFSSVIDHDQPQTIPAHDQIFWFGDLNYRLNMLDAEVRKLIASKQWEELINSDQLSKELENGRVFDGWKEGAINFPPTYKYEINTDRYVGENPKEGEKKRSPAWCDRILWLGKSIKQLSYKRTENRLSDHRPVSSVFLVEVEVFDRRKLQRALNFTNMAVHPDIFPDEEHFEP